MDPAVGMNVDWDPLNLIQLDVSCPPTPFQVVPYENSQPEHLDFFGDQDEKPGAPAPSSPRAPRARTRKRGPAWATSGSGASQVRWCTLLCLGFHLQIVVQPLFHFFGGAPYFFASRVTGIPEPRRLY